MTNRSKIIALLVLLLASFCSASCSSDSNETSPETIAKAFLQAAAQGNISEMQLLSVENTRNNPESLNWFANQFNGFPVDELVFQYEGNAYNNNPNIHRYVAYQGTKNVAVIHIQQIGENYYVESATTTLWME